MPTKPSKCCSLIIKMQIFNIVNNEIDETSVTIFLGMHLDKKQNFVNQ